MRRQKPVIKVKTTTKQQPKPTETPIFTDYASI